MLGPTRSKSKVVVLALLACVPIGLIFFFSNTSWNPRFLKYHKFPVRVGKPDPHASELVSPKQPSHSKVISMLKESPIYGHDNYMKNEDVMVKLLTK